jgi:hypothetical protein
MLIQGLLENTEEVLRPIPPPVRGKHHKRKLRSTRGKKREIDGALIKSVQNGVGGIKQKEL